jgi:hypothetical protein
VSGTDFTPADRAALRERFLRPDAERIACADLAIAVREFLHVSPRQPGERPELTALREKNEALLRLFREGRR